VTTRTAGTAYHFQNKCWYAVPDSTGGTN